MKKTLISIVLVVALLAVAILLSGCEKKEDSNSIVGSWKHSWGFVYTFNDDKTGSYGMPGSERNFTYEDDGSKVTILYDGDTDATVSEYRIEGKKFIIKDIAGNDVEYTKQ